MVLVLRLQPPVTHNPKASQGPRSPSRARLWLGLTALQQGARLPRPPSLPGPTSERRSTLGRRLALVYEFQTCSPRELIWLITCNSPLVILPKGLLLPWPLPQGVGGRLTFVHQFVGPRGLFQLLKGPGTIPANHSSGDPFQAPCPSCQSPCEAQDLRRPPLR